MQLGYPKETDIESSQDIATALTEPPAMQG